MSVLIFFPVSGLNVLGIVENMGEICVPLSGLESRGSGISLVDAKGVDVTDSVLVRYILVLRYCYRNLVNYVFDFRIKHSCPDLLHLFLKARVFAPPEDSGTKTPQKMAIDFEIPYLGSIPMDPNMLSACESGCSFMEAYPESAAAGAFGSIVEKIVAATSGAR